MWPAVCIVAVLFVQASVHLLHRRQIVYTINILFSYADESCDDLGLDTSSVDRQKSRVSVTDSTCIVCIWNINSDWLWFFQTISFIIQCTKAFCEEKRKSKSTFLCDNIILYTFVIENQMVIFECCRSTSLGCAYVKCGLVCLVCKILH